MTKDADLLQKELKKYNATLLLFCHCLNKNIVLSETHAIG